MANKQIGETHIMISMAPNLPPATLTDDSLRLVAVVLQICADLSAAKANLDALVAAKASLDDATATHAAAKTQAETAAAGLADLQQREQNLAEAQAALATRETQLSVANHANAARAASLDDREAELAKHIAEHEAKVKANEDRIAQVRASLSA